MSYSLDSSTSACDEQGGLLFYSNGMQVWDRSHTLMPNGSSLMGSNNGGQCALAVPWPGTNKFYLFTVGQWNAASGLRYSVIDMDLNGGFGDVSIANQLLFTPSTERLAVVYDPTGESWWVITHAWSSSQFRTFRITTAGLDPVAVISSVGSIHVGGSPNGYNAAGQLTASPDGSLVVCGIYSLNRFELFDFDSATGLLSNSRSLPGYTNAWGAAFSPDNSKLYLTKWFDNEVIQLDLSAGSWPSVQASTTVVGNTTGNVSGYQVGYLELGPDGVIYAAKFGQDNIARIGSPNSLGAACGFQDVGVDLGAGTCNAGLCRTLSAALAPCALTIELSPTNGCVNEVLTIDAIVNSNPIDAQWIWDFGDGSSSQDPGSQFHSFSSSGDFLVQVLVQYNDGGCLDSAQTWISIGPEPTLFLGTDTVLCPGSSMEVAPDMGSVDWILWHNGSSDTSFLVHGPGMIWAIGSNACGTAVDSLVVGSTPVIDPIQDVVLCGDQSARLMIPDTAHWIVWSTGESTRWIDVDQGTYWVSFTDTSGCAHSDTVSVIRPLTMTAAPVITNVFSPNGDGSNDRFGPFSDAGTDDALWIYDRWGVLVFEGTSAIGWDGRDHKAHEPVPDGTYFYILRSTWGCDPISQERRGSLSLLR